jgi:hypothetical protein
MLRQIEVRRIVEVSVPPYMRDSEIVEAYMIGELSGSEINSDVNIVPTEEGE